jgi:hypothetical protein
MTKDWSFAKRRQVLAAAGVTAMGGLAGCSIGSDSSGDGDSGEDGSSDTSGDDGSDGNGGDDGNGGNGGDDGNDGLSDVMGQAVDISGTADSDIDELEVIDHRMAVGEGSHVAEGALGLALLVENTGEATADLVFEYSYTLTVYDASDEEMFSDYAGKSAPPETNPLDPGASGPVVLIVGAYEPDQIGRYEATLTCQSFDEGTYCE